MRWNKGFTLLEAMIVIAVLGVVTAIAYPSFRSSIDRAEVKKAAGTIEDALNHARIAAIESNKRVTVCSVTAPQSRECDTTGANWHNGLVVFADDNANGERDNNETIIQFHALDTRAIDVKPNGNMSYITFLGGGSRASFSGGIPGTIVITPVDTGNNKVKICLLINMLGRVVRNEQCD